MSSTRYKPLPQSDDITRLFEEDKPQEQHMEPHINFLRSALMLVFALTVFDIMCLLYLAISPPTFSLTSVLKPTEEIPFLSTYTRLDNVYSKTLHDKSTPRPSIINTLRVLTHIDSFLPDNVEPLWPKRHITYGGMVPFDERHVTVTETISTIAEYHVLDYGMENCTIVLTFPPSETTPGQKTPAQNATLEVWLLDPSQNIDFNHLNFNSKPTRKHHIGTLVPILGSTQQTGGYFCKSGTTQIVEISCGKGSCEVHVPAGGHDAIGLYVQQYQTI